MLLLIVFGGVLSKSSSADAKSRAPKKHAVGRAEPKRPTLARTQTRVLVLNGNGITGAAAAESDSLRARGYKISGTGNAAQSYGQSVVLYRPGRLPKRSGSRPTKASRSSARSTASRCASSTAPTWSSSSAPSPTSHVGCLAPDLPG